MKKNGFTLIELMITVVIVAILAAVAYPSYKSSIQETRRAQAKANLMELASFMERFYTENGRYDETNATTPVAVTSLLPDLDDNYYNYDLHSKNLSATTYKLRAIPKGAQADDFCKNLRLFNTGETKPDTDGCW